MNLNAEAPEIPADEVGWDTHPARLIDQVIENARVRSKLLEEARRRAAADEAIRRQIVKALRITAGEMATVDTAHGRIVIDYSREGAINIKKATMTIEQGELF